MKTYIYLVCLVGIWSYNAHGQKNDDWLENAGSEDIDAYAERPCPHNDIGCIRRYFAQHSHCKMVQGRVPDPLLVERFTLTLPSANMTAILLKSEVSGLNGKVTEFTINKKTNNLVIAAEMRNITIRMPRVIFKYHRKRKEPIETSDQSTVNYASITFTAVIPNIDNLDFAKAEVFSYIEDSNPPYTVGTNFIASTDMDAIRSFNALVSNIPGVIKEALLYQGPVYMLNFIQYSICDYGVKINAN